MSEKIIVAILKPSGRVETEPMDAATAEKELVRITQQLRISGSSVRFVKLSATAVVNRDEVRYVTIENAGRVPLVA